MSLPDPVVAALLAQPRPVCAYVYSLSLMQSRAAALRAALPPGTTLFYAVKANAHPEVVSALAAVTDGLEIASGGEMALALAARARRLAFGGPGKTDAELRSYLDTPGPRILHVESASELRRLAWLSAGSLPRPLRVALRVNRASGGPAGSHRMTGATQFGIDSRDLPPVVALARELNIPIAGFHLHAVSNSLDAAEYARFTRDAVAWSAATAADLGIDLEYVNVGGGFGVSYTAGGPSFDLGALDWSGLNLPPGVELAVEPGRFLTAEAGWYAAEVLDLKNTRGTWYAIVRGGMHQFRLPVAYGISGTFEVLPIEEWAYPWPRPSTSDTAVTVAGELCTPNDILARSVPTGRLRVGDVIVFTKAGAYGWDISPMDYLHHPKPAVFTVEHPRVATV
jgi:2-[(L-alanin-3-ylcarbamoyl)methyl]-2-hydroxybutanedioate decarboxylase